MWPVNEKATEVGLFKPTGAPSGQHVLDMELQDLVFALLGFCFDFMNLFCVFP